MEIPTYSAFVDIINRAIRTFDAHLRQILHTQLDEAQRAALHSLLEQTVDNKTPPAYDGTHAIDATPEYPGADEPQSYS